MSGRSTQILARFPAHMEAPREGKVLGAVVAALALDLDTLAAALAGVRRAHRLADADELADLWRLAALHGMGPAEFEMVTGRFRRAAERLQILREAADDADRAVAAEALLALWSLAAAPPRFSAFADPDAPDDVAAASVRLAVRVGLALRHAGLTAAVRTRIARACAIQAEGNGTVDALLRGAANALDLELGAVAHSVDRYWHVARARDRLRLEAEAPDGTVAAVAVAEELLGVEENPLWRDETDNAPRVHGELYTLLRRGFDRALLQVRITGEGARTVLPMLVNRDEGHGIGYSGTVEAGQTLIYQEDGRVQLEGSDVTALAFAWRGACFAGDDAAAEADFVFEGEGRAPALKPARFAIGTPPAALDREAGFPSDGASLPMPGIAVGMTRLAFFVREAHFASHDASGWRSVTPRTGAAVFDASVHAPPPAPRTPSARVALSWLEHQAFAVRLLIPPRFRVWRNEDEGALTLQAVSRAIERYRPVGVAVRVEFIEPRWTLGGGTLTSGADDDPIESLRAGTELWPAPPEAVA